MSSPPKLENIFKRNVPSAAIDVSIPDKLPSTYTATSEEIKQAVKSSSYNPQSDVKKNLEKINKKDSNFFANTLGNKNCSLFYDGENNGKNYLTADQKDTTVILLFVKVVDGNGTPFYIDMGSYGKGDINISDEKFTETSAVVKANIIDKSAIRNEIKYFIASNKKDNQLIECGENKFCVVTQTDGGINNIDVYEIPGIEDFKEIKEDNKLTQTEKPPSSLNLEKDVLISYRIISYEVFADSNMKPEKLQNENLEYYNNQFKIINSSAREKMKNIADVFEDMKVLIDSFQKNYDTATKKSVEIRDKIIRNKIVKNEQDAKDKRDNCKKINIKLEEYVRKANKYNEEFVVLKRAIKRILENNNSLVDAYDEIRSL
jgi:hypothetical protein